MCGSVYVCLCANSTIGYHPMAILKKDDFIAIKNGLGYSQAILGYSFICMFFFSRHLLCARFYLGEYFLFVVF